MGTALPELGSKISLISNADIRYEGHLFTVDPQQCTIALAAVRSFGTENREVMCPVPPQGQIYDYILFRGSDIKDIRILNNVSSVPNDPAIMQLSMPTHMNKPFQPQSFGHPVMGHFGGSVYGGGDPHAQTLRTDKPSELNFLHGGAPMPSTASTLTPPVLEPTQARSHEHGSVLDLIAGGSRSTTPASCNSRKSPTADQSTQAGGKKDEKKVVKPIQPPKQQERRDSQQDHRNNQNRHAHTNLPAPPRNNQQGPQQHQVYHQNNQQYQQRNYNDQQRNYNDQQRSYGGQQHNQSLRGHPQRPRTRGRPRGNPGNSYNGQPTGTGYKQPNPINAKPKIKFESEFDFEEANSQFIKLCDKLEKTKLDEVKPEVNGAATITTTTTTTTPADVEKKDDSGNETGAGETEVEDDSGSVSTEGFYNKSKSFFDNISCEAIERQKGRSQRTDWRQERKLNTETFGVSSARHGGYRTRGGYHSRGYRGGYRSNYRNHQGGQRIHQGGQQQIQQGGESSRNNMNTNKQLEQAKFEEKPPTPVGVTVCSINTSSPANLRA